MASGNFEKALAIVLTYEGGNDDDMRDPGGRTSRGILQREYDRYRRSKRLPLGDVWKATQAEIVEIYRKNYWDRLRCEELPAGVDLTIFDGGVNSGVAQVTKWAQRACQSYAAYGARVDGDFGPATLQALQNQPDNDLLVADIMARRLAMLKGLKTWKYYGKGWSARVANCLKISQAWATGSVSPDPVNVTALGGQRKGQIEDVKQPLLPVTATQVVTTGTGISAGTAQVVEQLMPASEVLTWLKYILAALTVIGVLAGLVATLGAKFAQRVKDGDTDGVLDVDADLVEGAVPVPLALAAPAAT
jgi:lysozyme family protein